MEHEQFSKWREGIQQTADTIPNTPNTNWPALMSRKQAAEYLGVKEQTLACWATNKRYALPYIKIGRLVKYKREDLERFILENRFSDEALHV